MLCSIVWRNKRNLMVTHLLFPFYLLTTAIKSVCVSTGHHKWWDRSVEGADRRSETLNVEITAYALLTLQLVGRSNLECLPIVKWLLSQRNNRGGFKGTQDTILGIEALATFAPKIVSKEMDVNIDISTPDEAKYNFVVNNGNSFVLQSHVVIIIDASLHSNAVLKLIPSFKRYHRMRKV